MGHRRFLNVCHFYLLLLHFPANQPRQGVFAPGKLHFDFKSALVNDFLEAVPECPVDLHAQPMIFLVISW
jgi:hypothetical protein